MIITDDGFIVKGKKFTPSDVERILTNYIETKNENKIRDKQREHDGESLVEYCKRAYENDRRTCDNFYTLLVRRPYTYKGMKQGYTKECFPDVTITSVLIDTYKWQDYIIKSVHYGTDCSITVTAELKCKTVNDLIYYCIQDIDNDCVFHEVLTNKENTLDYVKDFGEEFEDTCYITEVDVNENKMIKRVHYMKNGGTKQD